MEADTSIDFGIMFSTPFTVKTLEKNLPFYSSIKSNDEKIFEIYVDTLN
jgi:hypothetical protein